MSDDQPSESPTVSYLKGYMYGASGILGSDSPMVATFGAMDADNDRRREDEARAASSEGNSGTGNGAGLAYALFLALISPPFFAPGYAVYLTWIELTVLGWHPLFKLLADGVEIFAICAVVWILYRFIPRVLGALLAALYIGLCYAWVLQRLGGREEWIWGIGIATAVIGFFLGRYMHKSIAASGMTFNSVGRGTIEIYAALSGGASFLLYWGICVVGGGWVVVKFFRMLDAQHQNGYVTFGASAGLAVAILLVPPFVGKKLVRHAPKPVARTLIMGLMAAFAVFTARLADLDDVWTAAATLTAAVGGLGLVEMLKS